MGTELEEETKETCSACDEEECICCIDCSQYPCECCVDCGEPPDECEGFCWRCDTHKNEWGNCPICDYCEECGDLKESCGGCKTEFGSSTIPPWEQRGEKKIKAYTDKTNWELIWPEISRQVDPVQSAADFYLLEAISAGVVAPTTGKQIKPVVFTEEKDRRFFEVFKIEDEAEQELLIKARNKTVKEQRETNEEFNLAYLKGQAELMLERLVDTLDPTFVAYSHMAISGELRHHTALGDNNRLSNNRSSAWCGWKKIYDTIGNQSLLDAAELFYEFTGSGYGGPPWANCAEVLYQRLEGKLGPDGPDGKINRRMFIDRIWTLEHNGGCFLNKISWSTINKKGWEVGSGYMRRVLDAHAADETNYKLLVKLASEDVSELFFEHIESSNKIREQLGIGPIEIELGGMKPKYVCVSCKTNAEIGHKAGCNYVEQGNIDVTNFNSEYIKMYDDEDDWEESGWRKWYEQTEQAKLDGKIIYNSKGILELPLDKKITATLRLYVTDTNRGSQYYSSVRELTFLELMTNKKIKWHIRRFGKNLNTPIGQVTDISYDVVFTTKIPESSKFVTTLFMESAIYFQEDAEKKIDEPIVLNRIVKNKIGDNWAISNPEKELNGIL